MGNSIEINNQTGPLPQRAYLAAAGACVSVDHGMNWRDLTNPEVIDGPLLYSYIGAINLDLKPEIPTGSRAVLQSMLILLAGKSEMTVRIAHEQIAKLSCDIGVSREDTEFLEDIQTNNSIRAAFNEASAEFTFITTRGPVITSREQIRDGNVYKLEQKTSYNQMATAIAFAEFINEMPIPWFEITELATGNGDQLNSLREIVSMIEGSGFNLGEYIRITTNKHDGPTAGQMPSAVEHVLLKLQEQGVVDVRIDPMSKLLPIVEDQVNRIIENQEDLDEGRAVFFGFDVDYVGTIIEAYNKQLEAKGKISTEEIYHLVQQQNSLENERSTRRPNENTISQHDVSVFLSRLKKKLIADGIDNYPKVLPAAKDDFILKRQDLKFNKKVRNIPNEVAVLLELTQEMEDGYILHSSVKRLMPEVEDRRRVKFGQKYLDFQTETRGIMAGFRNSEQIELFSQIVGAMNNFDKRYAFLTNTKEGREELINLFDCNLNNGPDSGEIGYIQEREEKIKALLSYYLDISTRIREALSGAKPTIQARPGKNKKQ